MSQNIMTTSLICCRFSVCCQNSDTPLRHGLYMTFEGVIFVFGTKMLAADISSPLGLRGRGRTCWSCEVVDRTCWSSTSTDAQFDRDQRNLKIRATPRTLHYVFLNHS